MLVVEEFMLRKITENLLEFRINKGRVDVDFLGISLFRQCQAHCQETNLLLMEKFLKFSLAF